MASNSDLVQILRVTTEQVYPSLDALAERLARGPVRVYHGIDPTSPVVHLGHTVPLRILKRFQEHGHKVVLLIGDFTATVGDPSGRDAQRAVLSKEQVDTNVLTIHQQLSRVLDLDQTEVRFNSEWFDDQTGVGSLRQFLGLIGTRFTAAQLWERDLFQVRQAKQQPVSLTEFIYPTLQAYDSVALAADVEVGGSDQTFNMLAGRTFAKQHAGVEKFVLTTPLIPGTDGRKMSKSYGNTIGVTDAPAEMFGRLMSIPDSQIIPYTLALTDRFATDRTTLESLVSEAPRDTKAMLAREVVSLYHGLPAADAAEQQWTAQFRDKAAPADLPEIRTRPEPEPLTVYLVKWGIASSKSEAQRLIEQGGIRIDGEKVVDATYVLTPRDGMIVSRGGQRWLHRLVVSSS